MDEWLGLMCSRSVSMVRSQFSEVMRWSGGVVVCLLAFMLYIILHLPYLVVPYEGWTGHAEKLRGNDRGIPGHKEP